MQIFHKIIYFLLIVVLISGCGDKYDNSNFWETINLSKKGIVLEQDITLNDDIFYRFLLEYIQDKESKKLEWEEASTKYKGDEKFNHISVFRIMGMGGKDNQTNLYKMKFKGSNIVLKITLIPYSKHHEKYKYRKGNDISNTILDYSNKKNFEIIADLSSYPYLVMKKASDNKNDTAYGKRILEIALDKGKYHLIIENINDVPEVKTIRTIFSIEPARYGKGF